MQKTERKIQGCMIKHLFGYRAGSEVVFTKEFLFDCENVLDFQFEDYFRKEDLNGESLLSPSVTKENIIDDDCYLDENEGGERGHQISEFLEVP